MISNGAERRYGTTTPFSAHPLPPQTLTSASDAVTGAAFVLDAPTEIPALWGRGEKVLWAEGEAMMICGGISLGKTSLAAQLIRALLVGGTNVLGADCAFSQGMVLGQPVARTKRRILYLAMDRPRQIARCMRRQFDETHRDTLATQLVVHAGPPEADLARQPTLLLEMARRYGAGIIFIDGLKDAAIGLSSDEVGAGWNFARQKVIAAGIELCELHHPVKSLGRGTGTLADVYGATWLTAGVGSVVMLSGEPGDSVIGFGQVKPVLSKPATLVRDEATGALRLFDADVVELARHAAAEGGLTVRAFATVLFGDKPSSKEIQSARRQLDKGVDDLVLTKKPGTRGGAPTAYFAAETEITD